MKGKRENESKAETRMELKYCEHCGGLWLRESGSGVVYCSHCQPIVADLPVPRKQPERVILPIGQHPVVEEYELEIEDGDDLEAAGGAA